MARRTTDTGRRQPWHLGAKTGLPTEKHVTHSQRRGGAAWMVLLDVPFHVIKALGHVCGSDCVSSSTPKTIICDILKTFTLLRINIYYNLLLVNIITLIVVILWVWGIFYVSFILVSYVLFCDCMFLCVVLVPINKYFVPTRSVLFWDLFM